MKIRILVSLSTALLVSALFSPRASADVSISVFRTALEPHGEWIEVGDYGPCWHPRGVGADWRPYTDGRWVYTDDGWCWDSDEPYGWAVYHYGRWVDVEDTGWCWVPDTEWAPAWVSFRHSDDYIGWAPLPPEARFRAGVAINFGGWVDTYFDIGPRYYTFVPLRRFGAPRLRDVILHREQNINIFVNTVNITNINFRDNRVFVGGPDYDRLSGRLEGRIPRLRLEREMDFAEDMRGDRLRSRIEADRFIVPAPRVSGDTRGLAANVSRRVDRPEFNRGWRDVPGDRADEIRRKMEREAETPNEVRRELTPTHGRQPGESGPNQDRLEQRNRDANRSEDRTDRRDEGVGRESARDRRPGSDERMEGQDRRPDESRRENRSPDRAPGARPDRTDRDQPEGRQDRSGEKQGREQGNRAEGDNRQGRQENSEPRQQPQQRSRENQGREQPPRNSDSQPDADRNRPQGSRSEGSKRQGEAETRQPSQERRSGYRSEGSSRSGPERPEAKRPDANRQQSPNRSPQERSGANRSEARERSHGYRSESGQSRSPSNRQTRPESGAQSPQRSPGNARSERPSSSPGERSSRPERPSRSEASRPSREASGERPGGKESRERNR